MSNIFQLFKLSNFEKKINLIQEIDINKPFSCIKCLYNFYIYLKFLVNKDFQIG